MSQEISEEQLAEAARQARERLVKEEDGLTRAGTTLPQPHPEALDELCPECGKAKELWNIAGLGPSEFFACNCERVRQAEEDLREWEAEQNRKRIESLRRRSSLPSRLERFTFNTFDADVSTALVRAHHRVAYYAENFPRFAEEGRGLVLFGAVGTGKTHLAVAAMQEIMHKHLSPCLFATVPYLLDQLRSTYSIQSEQDLVEESTLSLSTAARAELLVLDDLGTEKSSEWVSEKLFELINHRYSSELPTIITTNVGPQEIGQRLGMRIVSRLVESCEWIPVEGADYRFVKARGEA